MELMPKALWHIGSFKRVIFVGACSSRIQHQNLLGKVFEANTYEDLLQISILRWSTGSTGTGECCKQPTGMAPEYQDLDRYFPNCNISLLALCW